MSYIKLSRPSVILGHQRHGTGWVNDYVIQSNKKYHGIVPTLPKEFFIKNFPMPFANNRVKWLEENRKYDREFTIKYQINQLHRYDMLDWFIDFYQDWNIVVIDRRDTYRAFLSSMIMKQDIIWPKTKVGEDIEINHKIFRVERQYFDDWIKTTGQLRSFDAGTRLFYEDLDDRSLCDMFGLPDYDTPIRSYNHINYEQFVSNVDEVKSWFVQVGYHNSDKQDT